MMLANAKYIQSQLIGKPNFFHQVFDALMPIDPRPRQDFRVHVGESNES
jgi:hypothetical protein